MAGRFRIAPSAATEVAPTVRLDLVKVARVARERYGVSCCRSAFAMRRGRAEEHRSTMGTFSSCRRYLSASY